MNRIALRMLTGDAARYFGILFGLTFASLLIAQQSSIFVGLMARTCAFLGDTGQADVWVMDPEVRYVEEIETLRSVALDRVRGVEGVAWAVPLFKGLLRARMRDGSFRSVNVIGIDDASLIGGPPKMLQGRLEDLRRDDGIIVDEESASTRLSQPALDATGEPIPGAPRRPLAVGDTIEINDRRAVVVGICQVTPSFLSQASIYTTYTRALRFAPPERKLLAFVLAKAEPGEDHERLEERIATTTGLKARTLARFKWDTIRYYLENTGIPINFGIAVLLGFLVGTAIAGQTFYNFTLDNLKYFGALKAMGATNGTLLRMVLLQALVAGLLGYGMGIGLAAFFGLQARGTELAFRMIWQIPVVAGAAVATICALSAFVSMLKVAYLEPAVVFRS